MTCAVDVLVDRSGRLGALAYLVPDGLDLAPGDAVLLPFGKSTRHGMVLGPAAAPERATREVTSKYGSRVDPVDLDVAVGLAAGMFSSLVSVAGRFSPNSGRGVEPLNSGLVALRERARDPELSAPARSSANRLYLRAPLVDPARLAALEAVRLAGRKRGQVLVLCPTVRLLEAVLAEFDSGAARLDSKARAGAWRGFREGLVTIGVGTRTAALYSAGKLGGIVVVEEEHPGHLEATTPYWHARDVASSRASAHGCALTLISANPSASGMGARLKVVPVGTSDDWPVIQLIDRSVLPPHSRLMPPRLRKVLSDASSHAVPAAVLAGSRPARRVCPRCGDIRACVQCSLSGCTHPEPVPCTRCGSTGARWHGWDVTRLAAQLPGVEPVVFTDMIAWRDAAPGFADGQTAPDGRLVVLFDADGLMTPSVLEPEFAAMQVLLRAAEAAGPAGKVVILTSLGVPPVLAAFARKDQVAAAKLVWGRARTALLPPFGKLVTVRVNWERAPSTDRWPGVVMGPRKTGVEWEVLVACKETDLPALGAIFDRMRRRGKFRVWVR